MVKAQKCCCRANWEIRNNSSNVAAVLNPTRVKFHASHNTCYCSEKQVRPRLFSRPKKCIFDESDEEEDTSVRRMPTYRLNLGSTYRVPKMKKSQSGVKALTDKAAFDKSSCYESEYSSSSAAFPSYSRNTMGEDSSEYQKPSKSGIVDGLSSVDEENNGKKSRSSRTVGPLFPQSQNEELSSEPSLKQLSEFRKDHYFDTHSTEDLVKTIPEHTCVHKFGLDSRFLPQPLNADVYGESRCIICDKPMENPVGNKVDERFRSGKAIFPKFYKYGLAPKKIYMGSDDNVKIEMVLKDRQNDENWTCEMGKHPNYFNTYALRYQKGVKS